MANLNKNTDMVDKKKRGLLIGKNSARRTEDPI